MGDGWGVGGKLVDTSVDTRRFVCFKSLFDFSRANHTSPSNIKKQTQQKPAEDFCIPVSRAEKMHVQPYSPEGQGSSEEKMVEVQKASRWIFNFNQ